MIHEVEVEMEGVLGWDVEEFRDPEPIAQVGLMLAGVEGAGTAREEHEWAAEYAEESGRPCLAKLLRLIAASRGPSSPTYAERPGEVMAHVLAQAAVVVETLDARWRWERAAERAREAAR